MGDKVKGYRCVHHPQILTAYYKCKLHIGQCIAIDIVDLGHMDLVPPPTLILWHRSLATITVMVQYHVTGLINTVWLSYSQVCTTLLCALSSSVYQCSLPSCVDQLERLLRCQTLQNPLQL